MTAGGVASSSAADDTAAAAAQRVRARPKQIIEAGLQGLLLQPHCLRLLSRLREAHYEDELRLADLREYHLRVVIMIMIGTLRID